MFGTWDFKWPQGSQIDVHFQALPPDQLAALSGMGLAPAGFSLSKAEEQLVNQGPDEFGRLTRVVECLAQRWLEGTNAKIQLVFTHDQPLPLEIASSYRVQDYDVLVSLANLPLGRTADENAELNGIFLPGSELGRYCQRVDYSVPTTYLGMRRFYDGAEPYFNSKEFWHWCVHEFGHVLGLPHEHQNPKVHSRIVDGLKSTSQIQQTLANALGDTKTNTPNPRITEDEINEEITRAWPVPMKYEQVLYSDFRDYDEKLPAPDDSSSIMFHIYWQRLLKDAVGNEPPRFFERPRPGDLAHVRSMYPP